MSAALIGTKTRSELSIFRYKKSLQVPDCFNYKIFGGDGAADRDHKMNIPQAGPHQAHLKLGSRKVLLRASHCSQHHDEQPLSQRELEHEAQLLACLGQAFPKAAEPTLREAVRALQMAASMTRYSAHLRKSKLLAQQDRAELRVFQYRANLCIATLGHGAGPGVALKFSGRLDAGGTLTAACAGGTTTLPLLVPSDWLTASQLRTRKLIDNAERRTPDGAEPAGSG